MNTLIYTRFTPCFAGVGLAIFIPTLRPGLDAPGSYIRLTARFPRGFWYFFEIARLFRALEHLGVIRRQCLHSYWFGNIYPFIPLYLYPYTSGLEDTALRGQLQATGACVTASALWLPAPGADAGASGYQATLGALRLREERLTVRKLGGAQRYWRADGYPAGSQSVLVAREWPALPHPFAGR
jgi:hypothetical protein